MRHARTAFAAAGIALLLAGCSSGTSSPSAAPASQANSSDPPAACNLKSAGDIIERIVVPGQPATAQQLGSINLQNCTLAFSGLAQETSTDPGYCTTAAWAADNPGYNVDAVPAAPLKKIQAQAGQACGQG